MGDVSIPAQSHPTGGQGWVTTSFDSVFEEEHGASQQLVRQTMTTKKVALENQL